MLTLLEKIAKAQKENTEVVLCVVVGTHGSTPRSIGAKMLVYRDGKIEGTIGGGDLEKKVIQNALAVFSTRKPVLFKHDLLHYHNMCCGGSMDIYLEPIMKKSKLYIFGAGHTGCALAKMALEVNFETYLIDDRKEYLDEIKLSDVNKMCLPFQEALAILPMDEETYICIMTYSHPIDREILAACLKYPVAYLGMIGSQRKVEMTKKLFLESGIAGEEEVKKIDMPMGLNIQAEGPQEIAISVLAKLISVKNKMTV